MNKAFTKEEQKKLKGKIFFKKYKITNIIASGGFSCVYEGKILSTNEKVAIKIEKRTNVNYLETECCFLKEVEGLGFPKILSFGISGHYYILILEILGESLFSILQKNKKPLCIKDICMIAIQVIERLEKIHSKFILHRDIKPDNFLIGSKNNNNIIYLIDFGSSMKFRSSQTKKHFKFYKVNNFIGSREFISINGNKGIAPTRRDDLESAGYMFIFLAKGTLPWYSMDKGLSIIEIVQQTLKMKTEMPLEKLCENLPKEFIEYIQYCRNLCFEEDPDYEYLKNLFKIILEKNNLKNDLFFSWIKKNKNINNNFIKKDCRINLRKEGPHSRLFKKIYNSLSAKRKGGEERKLIDNSKAILNITEINKSGITLDNKSVEKNIKNRIGFS